MIIFDEKVSHRTQVRAPQVYAMVDACRLMQNFYRMFDSGDINKSMPLAIASKQKEESWLASQDPSLHEILSFFRHTALAGHFVCGNWKTCDELEVDEPQYLSRNALRKESARFNPFGMSSGPRFLPAEPSFMWLRRFIHSVVIWDVAEGKVGQPIRDVALCTDDWDDIADLLEHELDKAVGPDYDPWHHYVQQN